MCMRGRFFLFNSSAIITWKYSAGIVSNLKHKQVLLGPSLLRAVSREDAGSLLCLLLLLLFDYWAKLFNQVWNHKKAAVLHCPRTEPLLPACCGLCYLGTGGCAQLCKSPLEWLPTALLQCRRTQCVVWAVPRAHTTWGCGGEGCRPSVGTQTFYLQATSGISVAYVGNLGGQWLSKRGNCM